MAALTVEEFRRHLAEAIDVEPEALGDDADLRADLGLDSIQMFLLLMAVEDLGVTVPEQLFPSLRTVADAYHHYVTVSQHR